MKSVIVFPLMFAFAAGCAQNHGWNNARVDLEMPRIRRELNFYVAIRPLHETNHFFVYPTEFQHAKPIRAMVYWKEERTLLSYAELEPDASDDIFAWPGPELQLGRDTVDTPDEIGGSTYLETHLQWAESVERCISNGKEFSISKTDAQHLFPSEHIRQEQSLAY